MTTTTLITKDKDIALWSSYGRPSSKLTRWYLEAVCRETGRREIGKYVCKPTKKQIRKFKRWAKWSIQFDLYWSSL
ncbi:hypothetical protein AVV36_gp104 [Pectobacterium bacteriophage PM2]|uniref:Uncharacterized protein n=1 Tax=Pectobacterium bacteriophage PM2 TaxID=1429794 RepID=A0A0A0Q0E2_9CAUD|nr:hypothetical protein AVV36_gp104 [Pectobacterium bacteriophage PM2]AHY25066.1 hypothetical protein PM2_104 [Pectobacterium bacteriophage PM2]